MPDKLIFFLVCYVVPNERVTKTSNQKNKISTLIGMMIHVHRRQPQEVITAQTHLLVATHLLTHVLNCVPALQKA